MFTFSLHIFCKNTTEVILCPSQDAHNIYLSATGGINLDHLIKVVFARFLHCHATIFHV